MYKDNDGGNNWGKENYESDSDQPESPGGEAIMARIQKEGIRIINGKRNLTKGRWNAATATIMDT